MSRVEEIREIANHIKSSDISGLAEDMTFLLDTIDAGRKEANELFNTIADQEAGIDRLNARLKKADKLAVHLNEVEHSPVGCDKDCIICEDLADYRKEAK